MKEPLYFIAGLVIGAAGAYLGFKTYFEQQIEEETEAIKRYYDDKLSEAKEELATFVDTDEETMNALVEKVHNDIQESKKPERTAKPDVVISENEEEEYIQKVDYTQYNKNKVSSKLSEKPYVISEAEFGQSQYEQRTLSYFAEDEVLMDSETDEVITDIAKEVGYDNLETLSVDEDDSGNIYVRNEKYGREYMIVLEPGSYENYASDQEEW